MDIGRIAVLLGLIALFGCAGTTVTVPEPPKQAMNDTLIVPKSRIGPAALGMTEANLFEWLGNPDQVIRGDGGRMTYRYDGRGLYLVFERGRAVSVQARSSRYRTADGISVGTPELKVRAAWGQPTQSASLRDAGL